MKIAINSRLYLYAALLLFLASCKLDQPDFAGYHASDSTGKTGGTGTTTSTGTYQPVTKGSYWTYNYVLNGATDTVTTTITGNTSMINGRKYYEGISAYKTPTFPGDTGYFSKDDHIYTNLSTAGGVVVELYYLNDTTAVGHGWSAPINATGSILGTPGQFVGKVMEKGISKTINGKKFTNVIHTQVELQYNYGSGFTTEVTYDNYIAQNIGLIEVDSNGMNISGTETIIDYSIK